MKVGDLVEHTPQLSKDNHIRDIYAETGGDFKIGLVIQERESFRLIAPERGKPSWYQIEELEIISQS